MSSQHPSPPYSARLQGTQALGYVAWNLGARVEALIGRKGRMVVNLNKTPIWQGTKKKLGSLVTIDYASERCSHRSCAPRQLDITVRPFIKITVTQPWIPGAMPGARGSFAPYLEV